MNRCEICNVKIKTGHLCEYCEWAGPDSDDVYLPDSFLEELKKQIEITYQK